jgi:hypothetical protein
MRYLRFTLLSLLLAACTDTQDPLDQQPVFNYTNGKHVIEQADIYRFADRYWVGTTDGVLFAAHYDAINDHPLCDADAEGALWYDQMKGDINTWVGEAIRYVGQLRDAPVTIYPFVPYPQPWQPLFDDNGEPIPENVAVLCDWLDNDWLYRGTHNVTWTDNDITGFDDTPGINSWGWAANGNVMDQIGDGYKYHENQHYLFNPEACAAGDEKHCYRGKGKIKVH